MWIFSEVTLKLSETRKVGHENGDHNGSVKRVAGAVGKGSVAIGSVHQYPAEIAADVAGRKSRFDNRLDACILFLAPIPTTSQQAAVPPGALSLGVKSI